MSNKKLVDNRSTANDFSVLTNFYLQEDKMSMTVIEAIRETIDCAKQIVQSYGGDIDQAKRDSLCDCMEYYSKHYINGMKYLEQGMTQHARSSFVKAQRNYDRADMLAIEDYICAPMVDWFSNKIVESIING